jgi:hypothetical protein
MSKEEQATCRDGRDARDHRMWRDARDHRMCRASERGRAPRLQARWCKFHSGNPSMRAFDAMRADVTDFA